MNKNYFLVSLIIFSIIQLNTGRANNTTNISDQQTKPRIKLSNTTTKQNGAIVNHFYKKEPITATEKEFEESNKEYAAAKEIIQSKNKFSKSIKNNKTIYKINKQPVTEEVYKNENDKINKAKDIVFQGPNVIRKNSTYYKYGPKTEITEQEFKEIRTELKKEEINEKLQQNDSVLAEEYLQMLNAQGDTTLASAYRKILTDQLNALEQK